MPCPPSVLLKLPAFQDGSVPMQAAHFETELLFVSFWNVLLNICYICFFSLCDTTGTCWPIRLTVTVIWPGWGNGSVRNGLSRVTPAVRAHTFLRRSLFKTWPFKTLPVKRVWLLVSVCVGGGVFSICACVLEDLVSSS